VLTQMSVGISLILPWMFNRPRLATTLASLGSFVLLAGLIASVFHLGRPLKAWRAFLGLRTSWLSREIVAFSGLAPLMLGTLALTHFRAASLSAFLVPIAWATCGIGVLSVACSSMIYEDTKRISWKGWRTFSKFFGTTVLLGTACAWALGTLEGRREWLLGALLAAFQLLKFAAEHLARLPMERDGEAVNELSKVGSPSWQLERSDILMTGVLGVWSRSRMALGWLGGVALPLFCLISPASSPMTALAALLCVVVGESIERSLFFRAVTTFKMPGSP
jgi:formate dehydrogenase iron-sulfur subunit